MLPKAGHWCASQSAGAADTATIGLNFSNFNNLTHLFESQ
jgi:hypothetical protein